MSYLLKNNLLSNKQYGFIKGRSTMLQLLQVTDKWAEYLENGGHIDTIVISRRPSIRSPI